MRTRYVALRKTQRCIDFDRLLANQRKLGREPALPNCATGVCKESFKTRGIVRTVFQIKISLCSTRTYISPRGMIKIGIIIRRVYRFVRNIGGNFQRLNSQRVSYSQRKIPLRYQSGFIFFSFFFLSTIFRDFCHSLREKFERHGPTNQQKGCIRREGNCSYLIGIETFSMERNLKIGSRSLIKNIELRRDPLG